MENQANSKSIILNNGLYYGIASVILSLIFYALGMHYDPGLIGGLSSFALTLIFIILALRKFKFDNGGFMSWGQGVKIGIGTIVIGTIISVIYQQIFQNFIEPEYMEQLMIAGEKSMVDMGMTQEQIDAQMELSKKFQTPLMQVAFGLIAGLFFGFVISAITAAIMKKSEEETY